MPETAHSPPTELAVDRSQIAQFYDVMFRHVPEGSVLSLRTFDQFNRGIPALEIKPLALTSDAAADVAAIVAAAQRATDHPNATVFAPPVATFANRHHARSQDLEHGVAISMEVDEGDPNEALAKASAILGPPSLVMHSGSETAEGKPKLHAHWRLTDPTAAPEAHEKLARARKMLAGLVGGDPTASPVNHPLRWPGSWNRKGTPRMATICTVNEDVEVSLDTAFDALAEAAEAAGGGIQTATRATGQTQADPELLAAAVAAIPNGDVHYGEWVEMAYAICGATGGSDAGFEMFDAFSRKSEKYDPEETERTWSKTVAAAPNKIGAGTVFWKAGLAGWKRPPAPIPFTAQAMASENPAEAWPKVYTAADFHGTPAKPRQWAWGSDDTKGMMPLGETTLYIGPEGAGKSLSVQQIALSFARGAKLWGVPTRRMPVLVVNAEDPIEEMHLRAQKQGVLPSDDVRFVSFAGLDAALHPPFPKWGGPLPGETTMFHKFLDHQLGLMGGGDKLAILDNIGTLYQDDDTDKAKVRAFLRIVAALGKKHRVTFLLLGHPSGVQKNSGEGGFGAVAWAATVRSRLYFDYIRDGKGKQISETRVLSRKKANYGRTDANGDGIFLDWQDWSFVEVDRPDTNDETPAKAKRTVDAATAKSNDTMRANLDKAVAETLRSIRAGYFSTKTLAEMLVKRDDIEVSVRKLEGELSTLWEDKTRLCHGMYDPSRQVNKGRWHCPEDLRGTFAGTARRVTHAGTETVQ